MQQSTLSSHAFLGVCIDSQEPLTTGVKKNQATLRPVTQLFRDREGREIQLFSSEKYGLVGAVLDPTGTLAVVPGRNIQNPLSPKDTPIRLLQKLETCSPKMWDLVFTVRTLTITIFPHLIAAAGEREEGQTRPIEVSRSPFRNFSEPQLQNWMRDNGYAQSQEDPNQWANGRYNINIDRDTHDTTHIDVRYSPDYYKVVKGRHEDRLKHIDRQVGDLREKQSRGVMSRRDADRAVHALQQQRSRLDTEFNRFRHKWRYAYGQNPNSDPEGAGRDTRIQRIAKRWELSQRFPGGRGFTPSSGPSSKDGGPAEKLFQQTLQQTRLTESYNSSHRHNPIPAKGGTAGDIGGVACSTDYLTGLFDSPESLFESEHCFVFPNLPKDQVPFTDQELGQILRELAIGVYVHSTVPFFSLHFNEKSDLFPVIHPAYENTLVGRVIGMLDYIMKGYLNGGVFDEDFIDQWHQDPSWERRRASSLQRLIDFERYCEEHLEGKDKRYRSFGDLYDSMNQLGLAERMLRAVGQDVPEELAQQLGGEPPILRNYALFNNSFRIISKINRVEKQGKVLLFDTDFDVEYTIQPSPVYEEALNQHIRGKGSLPASYGMLVTAYEAMKQQIHDHMVKFPLCRDYFSMLAVITTFSSYFSTLKKHRKVPILPSMQADRARTCPPLFPHLPIKTPTAEKFEFNVRQVFERVKAHRQQPFQTYVRELIRHIQARRSFDGIHAINPRAKTDLIRAFAAAIEGNALELASPPLKRFLENKMEGYRNTIGRTAERLVGLLIPGLQQFIGDALPNIHRISHENVFTQALGAFNLPDMREVLEPVEYRIQRVAADLLPNEMIAAGHLVGGCGVHLEPTRVVPSVDASLFVQENYAKIAAVTPALWQCTEQGVFFRILFEDLSAEQSEEYGWMESTLLTNEPVERTQLRLAIERVLKTNNREEFERLVATGQRVADLRDRYQRSIMHLAAAKNDPYYVRYLLSRGFASNVSDAHGYLPIHYAAKSGALETLRAFARQMNAKNRSGSTPFIVAIQHEQLAAVRYFVENRAPITTLAGGYNTLHCALHAGNRALIDAVLSHPSIRQHINEMSKEGGTPLMLACELDDVELISKMLQLGAEPNTERRDGVTAMEIALLRNCRPVVQRLLACVPLTAHAIERAVQKSTVDTIALIETNGPFYAYRNSCQDTALHLAIRAGSIPVAQYIVERCANINYLSAPNIEGERAMSLSISLGLWGLVKALIAKGVAYEMKSLFKMPYDSYLKTLFDDREFSQQQLQNFLLIAAKNGNYEAISYVLLPKGATVEGVVGPNGWTVLHYLAKADGIYLFKHLFAESEDFHHRLEREGGKTLSYIAAENKSERVLAFLIEQMIRQGIAFTNHYLDRHLFYPIVESGNVKLCKRMLNSDATLANQVLDAQGTRAIHLAAKWGFLEIVEELKKRGADLAAADQNGLTPLTYAVRSKASDVVTFLSDQVAWTEEALLLSEKLPSHRVSWPLLQSALMQALRTRNTKAFTRLLPHLPTLDFTDAEGFSPYLLASATGQREALQQLTRDGRTVNGNNALQFAALGGHAHCVSRLLEAGFSAAPQLAPTHRGISQLFDRQGRSYLRRIENFWSAAKKENVQELTELFHDLPLNETIYIPEISYWGTPLQVLLFMGKANPPLIQQVLADETLDVGIRDCKGNTLAHLLAKGGVLPTSVENLDLRSQNFEGETLLHLAAAHMDVVVFRQLLLALYEQGVDLLHVQDHTGRTPLFHAIERENAANVRELIDRGADPNCYDYALKTPLVFALEMPPSLSILKILLEKGADPNQVVTPACLSPLLFALHMTQGTEFVHCLLKAGADCTFATNKGLTAAHFAAEGGNISLLRLLSAKGISLSQKDYRGRTPLHLAALHGKTEAFTTLTTLEENSVNQAWEGSLAGQEKERATPLQLAAFSGEVELVEKMLKLHADPEAKDGGGSTLSFAAASPAAKGNFSLLFDYKLSRDSDALLRAACSAIKKDNPDALIALYERGIAIDSELRKGVTGLHIASLTGALQCTHWLLQKGADPYRKSLRGENALEFSAANDSFAQFKCLLESVEGALDYQDEKGNTLLHIATQKGNLHHVVLLMALGCSLEACNAQGYLPLHIAAKEGHEKLVALMLPCVLNHELPSPSGKRPIDLAADPKVRQAFDRFQNTLQTAIEGETALHLAVRDRNALAVQFLAQTDDDLNVRNALGQTPLHLAVQFNQGNLILHLMQRGADCTILDNQGRNPVSFATDEAIMRLLNSQTEEEG